MKKVDIVRAWKDEDYRLGLSAEELSDVPESPVGAIELSDMDLEHVAGGAKTRTLCLMSLGCCDRWTVNSCTFLFLCD